MQLHKVTNDESVVTYLAGVLRQKLGEGKVLWLVPGGSAIAVAVAVSQKLQDAELENLTVTLTDERFGSVGHSDSNWQQLQDAGFNLPGATAVPVLHGHDRDQTTSEYAQHLQEFCQGAAYCVGLFGIGPDGHTAGIIPGSPAVTATEWAASFDNGDYQRITMTAPAIAALSEAVVYAMGEAKLPQLERLQQDLPITDQPAQALKQVPKLTIFNDQTGDTV